MTTRFSSSSQRQGRTGTKTGAKARNRYSLAKTLEALEPRLLLTGAYSPDLLNGLLNLFGMNKNGSLTFNGISAITDGNWSNQSGPPITDVTDPSSYTVASNGQVALSLTTEPDNTSSSASATLSGVINGTRDLVALNEASSGTPLTNGLDLLVASAGNYTTSTLAGTWNIAAQGFRGSITINSQGTITGGTIYLESNQPKASVHSGGTATINADGSGTLNFTTSFGTTSTYHSESLAFSMNAARDVMVANAAGLGDGSTPAELTVLVKNSGTYAASDVVGTTWDLNSALGVGSLNFAANHALSGSYTNTSGILENITGTYILGGNGTVTVNMAVTPQGGGATIHESFTGVLNQHKNIMALDRAIANGQLASSLTILTNPANHAPTERLVATWPTSAYQTSAIAFDFNTLVSTTVANVNDLDLDTLKLKITAVPAASGTLQIIHNHVTSDVNPGTTEMVLGDTLLWSPATTSGLLNAFSIQADDGTQLAANATRIFVNTGPLPVVSAVTTKLNALEAKAGTASGTSGFGTIVLQRAGGQPSSTLTVTVQIGGTAVLGTNYTLVGPDGPLSISTANSTTTVSFLANQSTVTLFVEPIQDNVVDPTLTVTTRVLADPNTASPLYAPSVHPLATVKVLDSNPTIVILPAVQQIRDGRSDQLAFYVERLPAQGGSLANVNNTVTITYSGANNPYVGTQNVANDLPVTVTAGGFVDNATTVTFTSDQVKKVIRLSPGYDGVALTEQITATIAGTTFTIPAGMASATINVTDSAPTVHINTVMPTAEEASPQTNFGEFRITRTGSTDSALTVALTTAGTAAQGTNYTLVLANDTTQTLTASVTIPSGTSSVNVELLPIDDGLNDGNLKATVTLVPDATPSYHVGLANKSVITILNNNRFPTLGATAFSVPTALNTPVQFTYSALQTDTDAALATGSLGTLKFQVGKVFAGQLKIKRSGSSLFVAAGAALTIVNSGDTLEWIPPAGLTGVTQQAFTLFARDGSLDSLSSALVSVTIT